MTERDELAAHALRRMLAKLAGDLHAAIDEGLNAEALHDIVGLWEANNINDDLSYDGLVAEAAPTSCDDCSEDVTPYADDGYPVEGGWELYMVEPEVWAAASRDDGAPRFLCIGCLETRIGRRLTPDDFTDAPVNEPGWMVSERLNDRMGFSDPSR